MIETFDDLLVFVKAHYRDVFAEFRGEVAPKVPVPAVLARLYSELGVFFERQSYPDDGSERHFFATQDSLAGPREVKVVAEFLEIAIENQGNWTVRCDQEGEDPCFYSDAWEVFGEAEGFLKQSVPLSHFLTTIILQEMVMSSVCVLGLKQEEPQPALKVPVEPLWLDGRYVFDEPSHQFYYSREHRMLAMNYQGGWVAGESKEIKALLKDPSTAIEIRGGR